MWLESGDRNCLQCLGLGTASLRFDKRNRPYVVCMSCGSRTFLKGRSSLAGLAVLDEIVSELARAAAADPARAAEMQHRLDAFVVDLQARAPSAERSRPRARQTAEHAQERTA